MISTSSLGSNYQMAPLHPGGTEVSSDNNLHVQLTEDLPLLPSIVFRGTIFMGEEGIKKLLIKSKVNTPSYHKLYLFISLPGGESVVNYLTCLFKK